MTRLAFFFKWAQAFWALSSVSQKRPRLVQAQARNWCSKRAQSGFKAGPGLRINRPGLFQARLRSSPGWASCLGFLCISILPNPIALFHFLLLKVLLHLLKIVSYWNRPNIYTPTEKPWYIRQLLGGYEPQLASIKFSSIVLLPLQMN